MKLLIWTTGLAALVLGVVADAWLIIMMVGQLSR